MATVIVIANQKGGVGKTTLSTTLTDALTKCDYKTMLIDMDPQENSTSFMQATVQGAYTLHDVMEGECTVLEAVQHTPLGDILPGDALISGKAAQYQMKLKGYNILNKALEPAKNEYDFIIIDTPPSLGIFLVNALTAADEVIIPVKAEKFAIDGLGNLMNTITEVKEECNPKLHILGAVLMAYDSRIGMDKQVKRQLPIIGQEFNFTVFDTAIRVCQEVKKAQNNLESIFDAAPKSTATADYLDLVKEIIKELEDLKVEEE